MKFLLKLFALAAIGVVGYAIVDPQGFDQLTREFTGGSAEYATGYDNGNYQGEGPVSEAYSREDRENYPYSGQPDIGSPPSNDRIPDQYSSMSASELRLERDKAYLEFTAIQRDPRSATSPELRNEANYWYNRYLLYDRALKAKQADAQY